MVPDDCGHLLSLRLPPKKTSCLDLWQNTEVPAQVKIRAPSNANCSHILCSSAQKPTMSFRSPRIGAQTPAATRTRRISFSDCLPPGCYSTPTVKPEIRTPHSGRRMSFATTSIILLKLQQMSYHPSLLASSIRPPTTQLVAGCCILSRSPKIECVPSRLLSSSPSLPTTHTVPIISVSQTSLHNSSIITLTMPDTVALSSLDDVSLTNLEEILYITSMKLPAPLQQVYRLHHIACMKNSKISTLLHRILRWTCIQALSRCISHGIRARPLKLLGSCLLVRRDCRYTSKTARNYIS